MFRRIGEAFRRFMYGRYGSDELNIGLLVTAVIVSLLHSILTLFLGSSQVYVMIISPLLYLLLASILLLLGSLALYAWIKRSGARIFESL